MRKGDDLGARPIAEAGGKVADIAKVYMQT